MALTEKQKAQRRAWYRANRERVLAEQKQQRQQHPERYRTPRKQGLCAVCDKPFEGIKGKMYCSDSCKTTAYLHRHPERRFKPKTKGTCPVCGTAFEGISLKQFCSKTCWQKDWSRRNPEKVKAIKNKWLQANYEKRKEAIAKYNRLNPEKRRERHRRWAAANRDKINAYARERIRRLGGSSKARRAGLQLLAEFGPTCQICQQPLEQNEQGQWIYDVDHIKPIKHGGTSEYHNLQLSHPSCNYQKWCHWDGTEPNEPPAQLNLFD